ncbi:MAG: hypothetical protein KAH67_07520 [Flavobacteriaceae bacterium]|nr:hypothetical protein [Flavobacteriaceae bacterium]
MKYFFKSLITTIVISFIVIACSSPKKLLEKGNYYQAAIQSVEKLKKNPNNKKARETLEQAYPLAVNNLLDKLKNDNLIQPQFANSNTVYTYEDLNRVYERIQQSPIAKEIIKNPEKFYNQLSKAKPLAAEEQYKAGIEQLAISSRENSKQAYYYFQESDSFVQGYKDTSEKMDQAYNMALLHVVADFKPVNSRMYNLSANTFYNELEKSLNQLEKDRFVRFYSVNEAKKENIKNADQYIKINFEDFVVGETHTRERIENMEKDSIKVGDITLDSGRKKAVYGTVNAKVSINHMETISKGIVNLSIIENNESKKVLLNENIPGQYVWFNEWGYFNGDERALTKQQLEICNAKNIPPPPPQQMFVEFTKPIHDQIRRRLVSFYRNY